MPLIQVPVPDYTEFKILTKKKVHDLIAQRAELQAEVKRIERILNGNKKDIANEPGLNFELYSIFRENLPADVKSFRYAPGHARFSFYQGDAQRRLDTGLLLTKTFDCPHCEESVILPAAVLDACKKLGNLPKPTVSVTMDGDEDEGSGR